MIFFNSLRKEKFIQNKVVCKTKKERADVLLVYPIWVKRGGRGKLQRMLPPLGILSIASFLEKYDYEVHVVDLHAEVVAPETEDSDYEIRISDAALFHVLSPCDGWSFYRRQGLGKPADGGSPQRGSGPRSQLFERP